MGTYRKSRNSMFLFRIHAVTLVVILVLIFSDSGTSQAAIIVDPDAFTEGTNISNAFPGVTLSAFGSGNVGQDIFVVNPSIQSVEPFQASTGTFVFGTNGPYPHLFWDTEVHLQANFANPVSLVSIDFIGTDASDVGELFAYNASNNLLDSATTPALGTNQVGTLTVSSLVNNIAYIVAAGDSGASTIGIDNLQYIPEPATVCLLGLGSLVLRRRKR